jgi:hypothetical protein
LIAACLGLLGIHLLQERLSFCEAMTLPLIFSLPVVNSFIGSALPVVMSMKSASLISSVQSAAPCALGDRALAGLEIDDPGRVGAGDLEQVAGGDLADQLGVALDVVADRDEHVPGGRHHVAGTAAPPRPRPPPAPRPPPPPPAPTRFFISASTRSRA